MDRGGRRRPGTDTQELYRRFGAEQAAGSSPTYERLAVAVADDEPLRRRLEEVAAPARQPNLLFGAVRHLGGPVDDPRAFLAFVEREWESVSQILRTRTTQTNEAGRCAPLLPVLAAIPGPLALLEVGASAGLCLYPDRYSYVYDLSPTVRLGSGPVTLACQVRHAHVARPPLPDRLPDVVWRAGVDLNPLDPSDPDDLRWLLSLVWPEHADRRRRLLAAARLVAEEPSPVVAGDLLAALPELVARARREAPTATVVVFHSAVLAYLEPDDRDRFTGLVHELGVRWVSNEGFRVLPRVRDRLDPGMTAPVGGFLLALDGRPVAFTDPHGRWLHWLAPHR
ncbi:DUF2332 domain-containing protein [Kineococcus gynurae]|uniref:DUF2332 domain-containing protein n=1 Tax=Kineococcus gynurae TaxID=452979 RepID=A0ABV5LRT0_9ACTN